MESKKEKATAYLTQVYGENTSRKFKLMCSKVKIGRSVRAEIRLQNPNVSRNHATLSYTGKGWTITDNKSQNGTYISGRKLKPGETQLLQCGDIIFLGPPAEMPEAFCYDDAFVDDDDIPESGHEIIELPPIKHPAEEKKTASKEKSTADVLISEKIPDSSQWGDTVNQTSHRVLHDISSSVDAPPSKQSKLDNYDSGYQIHEISSTGDDKVEDSLSLLDTEKKEVIEPCCSFSDENKRSLVPLEDSQTHRESDILKSKLALMSEQLKRLEESKLNLQKNYEIVCEKNFSLDQQLADKKKLEDDLKSCELKVKDKLKNELLEKFEEDLICNICTELLIKPAVLDCSHTFCLHCIKEWKKKKNECPMCRRKIQTMTPVLTLEHFIDKTLATLTPEQKDRRNQLIRERENPPKKAVTPTARKSRYHGRRRFRRSFSSINRHLTPPPPPPTPPPPPASNEIEIVDERRNNILPLRMPSVYLSIPDMFINSDRDSLSIYIT